MADSGRGFNVVTCKTCNKKWRTRNSKEALENHMRDAHPKSKQSEAETRPTKKTKRAGAAVEDEAPKVDEANVQPSKGPGRSKPEKQKKGRKKAEEDAKSDDEDPEEGELIDYSKKTESLYSPRILEDAKKMIKMIFPAIRNDYNEKLEKNEVGVYHKSLVPKKKLIKKQFRPLFAVKPMRNDFMSEVIQVAQVSQAGPSIQNIRQRIVNPLKKMPDMNYWVPIEDNVVVDDCHRLTHIPFHSEDQDDEDLCRNFIRFFDEGIHGYLDNFDYINDHMMYHLLKKLHEEWKQDRGHLYYALFKMFPNKYSFRQFEKRFNQHLQYEIGGMERPKETDPESQRLANVKMLEDARTTVCYQCRTFDCLFHGYSPVTIGKRSIRKTWFMAEVILPSDEKEEWMEDCSENCYQQLPRARALTDIKYCEAISSNPEIVGIYMNVTLLDHLTILQRSMVSSFYGSPDMQMNPCQMKRLFQTELNCAEIYSLVVSQSARPSEEDLNALHYAKKISMTDLQRNFRNSRWQAGSGKVSNKHRFQACNHEGPCGSSNPDCVCGSNEVCTKFCLCPDDCKIRFPGCRCAPGNCRTKQCQCFYAKWECDPLVCKNCNCDDENEDGSTMCHNLNLTRGNRKMVCVGVSCVAGYGAFIMEPAEPGELVAEYTGEVVSNQEADRRGKIYDLFHTSYLFDLNSEQSLDANRLGNSIRFANHSSKNPNCYSQILIVDGEHRIGLFAKRALQPYEELLFNYDYTKWQLKQFVPVEIPMPRMTRDGSNVSEEPKRKRKKRAEKEHSVAVSDTSGSGTSGSPSAVPSDAKNAKRKTKR